METTIAIIKPNNFKFNKQLYYNNKQQLTNDISQFIEFKTILFDDMMETIIVNIGLTSELLGNSPTCFETSTNVYQVCYIDASENNDAPMNSIASYLTGERIDNTSVVISSFMNNQKIYVPDNVDIQNIIDILYSKFVHKGIYIGVNNQNAIEFDYFNHPIEYYNIQTETDFHNYKFHEFAFLGFDLCMVIEVNSNNINKKATRLLGNDIVNGDILLILKSSCEFNDLSLSLYDKMNKLSFGPLVSRQLNDNEKKEENNIAINKYSILEERYNSMIDKCHFCNMIFTSSALETHEIIPELICTGCFRLQYHNQHCQMNDWNNHKKECLYNKSTALNSTNISNTGDKKNIV